MRYVGSPFPGDNRAVSVLGFGCSALLGRTGRKESLRALSAATDAGINFFDTARSYGYGDSEGLLGEFLEGRRHEAIICTKFGILPGARGGWKQALKPVAQAAIRFIPQLRSVARRAAAGSFTGGHFSVAVLRDSLHASLRELKTDYVDMLLMHAAPAEVLHQDDLLAELERLVEEGKVRIAGISGERDAIAETFRARPPVLKTAQFAVNRTTFDFIPETRQAGAGGMFLVANHPFGGPSGVAATTERIARLRDGLSLPANLRAKLDPADPQTMPEVILNAILVDTGISAVVPAMMRPENLRRNVRAVTDCRFNAEEIETLRQDLIRQP